MLTRKIKYDLYLLGWHSFQQLCIQITRTVLGQTVESYLESNDGGKDGAFTGTWKTQKSELYHGTFVVQCKHTSKKDHNINISLLSDEINKAKKLINSGHCDVYVLLTNLKVSAIQRTKIAEAFKAIGTKYFLLLGNEWICEQIAVNKSLRTSVPRLYGLGDLSQILDERAYAQAQAVIETIKEDLAKIVITGSYKKSAEALNHHGFVLLVGEPAAGKTTIAYMLAMAAMDQWDAQLIAADTAEQMIEHWNAEASENQLFWIDDAFGVTQYESSLAHQWNRVLPKIQSMLRQGIKIVMTSRNYIYERARKDLKTSAFPLFQESQVVVDVHALTLDEKKQILYNHLKLGKQTKEYLREIKPYLLDIAQHERFVPEVARRLGDPIFTKELYLSKYHINEFLDKQEQFLMEVIEKLDVNCKACLGLIYMRRNKLESPVELMQTETEAITRIGGTLSGCIEALNSLNGTLVILAYQEDQSLWRFKHPTIGDAFSKVVIKDPELLDIYLTGSATEDLIRQITCGNIGIEKAIIVPKKYFPSIIARLKSFSSSTTFKSKHLSRWKAKDSINAFLATRCSKDFLQLYMTECPNILEEICNPSLYLDWSEEVRLVEKLFSLDMLPEDKRKVFVESLIEYAVSGSDLYAIQDLEVRELFIDDEFDELKDRIINELVPKLTSVRYDLQREISKDTDPEDGMNRFFDMLKSIQGLSPSDHNLAQELMKQEQAANEWIEEERDTRPDGPDSRDLNDINNSTAINFERNIFDDIDE